MKFKNAMNDYEETVSSGFSWLWCFLWLYAVTSFGFCGKLESSFTHLQIVGTETPYTLATCPTRRCLKGV